MFTGEGLRLHLHCQLQPVIGNIDGHRQTVKNCMVHGTCCTLIPDHSNLKLKSDHEDLPIGRLADCLQSYLSSL